MPDWLGNQRADHFAKLGAWLHLGDGELVRGSTNRSELQLTPVLSPMGTWPPVTPIRPPYHLPPNPPLLPLSPYPRNFFIAHRVAL